MNDLNYFMFSKVTNEKFTPIGCMKPGGDFDFQGARKDTGKYWISSGDDMEKFRELYCGVLKSGHELHLKENTKMPVIYIDIDAPKGGSDVTLKDVDRCKVSLEKYLRKN